VFCESASASQASLPQDYLNVRGHVSANVTQVEGPGGRKRLWLIQMILLTHLKAGFEKRG